MSPVAISIKWKQPKVHQLMDEQTVACVYTTEYYLAIKRNSVLTLSIMQMDLKKLHAV